MRKDPTVHMSASTSETNEYLRFHDLIIQIFIRRIRFIPAFLFFNHGPAHQLLQGADGFTIVAVGLFHDIFKKFILFAFGQADFMRQEKIVEIVDIQVFEFIQGAEYGAG